MDRKIQYLESLEGLELKRNFQIERAPKGGKKIARLIWSNLLVIAKTHWRGRTQPCTAPWCDDCDRGQIAEVKSWLLTIIPGTEEKRLTEFTLIPTATLKELQDRRGHLNGVAIELGRKNDRDNGPVFVRIVKEDCSLSKFGPPPDLRTVLETMWRFDPEAFALSQSVKGRREGSVGVERSPQGIPQITDNTDVPKIDPKRRKRS